MHSFDSGGGSKGSWVWLKGVMCSPTRLPLAFIFSLRGGFKSIRRMSPPRPQDWTVLGLGLGSFFGHLCYSVIFGHTIERFEKTILDSQFDLQFDQL